MGILSITSLMGIMSNALYGHFVVYLLIGILSPHPPNWYFVKNHPYYFKKSNPSNSNSWVIVV
uniref:Uncharacterized protein n=1 Tax=Meloidogyne incognita TaxID=6306 RepID=A0A914M4N6_MELIC